MTAPRESDALDEELKAHIERCDQCKRELEAQEKGTIRKFGTPSRFCDTYFFIIQNYRPPGSNDL